MGESAKLKLGEDKKGSREVGVVWLKDAITQIDNTKLYFKMEKMILGKIVNLYEEDPDASLETVLKGTRTTMSPDDQARLQMTAEQKKKMEKHQQKMDAALPKASKVSKGLWEFIEREDKIEVTVMIPVPAA